MDRTLFSGMEGILSKYMAGILSPDFARRLVAHCAAHDSYRMNMKDAVGMDNPVRYTSKDLKDANTYLRMGIWIFPKVSGVFPHAFTSSLRMEKRFDSDGRTLYSRYEYAAFPYRADGMTFDGEWGERGSTLLSFDDLPGSSAGMNSL